MKKQRKIFQKITIGFLSLMLIGLFAVVTSCKDDEEKYDVTHKIVYKAEVSAGSNLTSAASNSSDSAMDPISINGTTWTSPEFTETEKLPVGQTVNRTKTVVVKAAGANASSTLKVQIYVDGALKKEVTTTGQDLKTRADYSVEYKVN